MWKNEYENWLLIWVMVKFVYLVNLIDLRWINVFCCWFYINIFNVNKGFNNRLNIVVKN